MQTKLIEKEAKLDKVSWQTENELHHKAALDYMVASRKKALLDT